MKNLNNKGFSLVELLVVITILAIISVVAYQNFGWATDKAITSRKINDVSTIETALQQYKVDKNQYPAVDLYNASTNMWWYNTWTTATPSNTISVIKTWEEITTVNTSTWWWIVYGSWISQIWAKWTISQDTMWKQYLSKDLYDPELWDLKISWWWNLIDKWIWRYVYAVYTKANWSVWWSNNKLWSYYNIAYTIKKEWTDSYISKIVWDFDENSCFDNKDKCPETLIWSLSWSLTIDYQYLVDKQEQWKTNSWSDITWWFDSTKSNQWIPYTINF